MLKDNQVIVNHFYSRFNIRKNSTHYGMALGMCNNILSKYKTEDILEAIDLLFLNQPKGGVYSFAYLPYVVDELIIKVYEKKTIKQNTDFETLETKNKKIEVKNNFANKGLVKF